MPACTHPHAITPILLEYTHHFPLDRGSIEGDTNIITLKNSTCYYIRDVPTVALVLRGSVVYIATPDTSAPGSNPGKGAPLIGGCGFESHFQNVFDTFRPGPDARIALCNGDARGGMEARQRVSLHDGTRDVSLLEGTKYGLYPYLAQYPLSIWYLAMVLHCTCVTAYKHTHTLRLLQVVAS